MPPVTPQNRDRIRTISFYAAFALVTYLLYVVTRPFIVPLCAAAILVVFFYPAHIRFERRYRAGPAAFLSTLLVTAMLIVPVLLVLSAFVREAGAAASTVQAAVAAGEFERVGRWWTWLQQHAPIMAGIPPAGVAGDFGRKVCGVAAPAAGGPLRQPRRLPF